MKYILTIIDFFENYIRNTEKYDVLTSIQKAKNTYFEKHSGKLSRC